MLTGVNFEKNVIPVDANAGLSLCCSKRLDEQQLVWDQREVELERQLDQYQKHQSDIISRTGKVRLLTALNMCPSLFHLMIANWLQLKHKLNAGFSSLKPEDGRGLLPDPSLPLAQQLEFALAKIREHVRTISDTKAACKHLDEVQFSLFVCVLFVFCVLTELPPRTACRS